mgnify:CR=1 FL=1
MAQHNQLGKKGEQLAVNFLLIIGSILIDDLVGQFLALLVLTVAASEASIGLALMVAYYRVNNNISLFSLLNTNEVSIFVGQFLKVKKSNEVSIMFKKLPVGTFSSSVAKISELVTCSSWFLIVFSCPSKLK